MECRCCGYRWTARVERPVRCAACRSRSWDRPRLQRSKAASSLRGYVRAQTLVQRDREGDGSPQERLRTLWIMMQQQARWDAVRGLDAVLRWRTEKVRAQA